MTGASSGIGAETVRVLRREGWDVVGVARRADRLAALAAETGADTVVADITRDEDVAALAEHVRSSGGADVLINNAGGALGLDSVEDSALEDWEQMYDSNVLGTKRVIAALLPVLRESVEEGRSASILAVTSIAGREAYAKGGGYNAAKFAERALLRALRLDLVGEPIRVIDIAPGMVKTEEFSLVRFGGDQARADAVYEGVETPLTAEDVAQTIRFAVELPPFVNLDEVVIKPVAQAAPYSVAKGPLRVRDAR